MLFKAGLISLVLLLLSRVLGVVRESAQAGAFGASATGDVVVLMLALPDWLAGVAAGGALVYVLLPHWARVDPAGVTASQRGAAKGLLAAGVGLAVLVATGAQPLSAWLIPGLPPAQAGDVPVQALRWAALAVPAALLAALWATRLQHERDFVGVYSANLVINGALVAALAGVAVAGAQAQAVTLMGLALLAAALLRLAWLRWRLPPAVESAAPAGQGATTLPARRVWAWAVLSAGLPLALPFVARSLASRSGEGALAIFNYAWKLVELPLVLAIQLAASLAFPVIARVFATGDDPTPALRRAFGLTWMLACAAAAGLFVGAPAAAQLLFGWGRMDTQGLDAIATWGAVGAWGLLPQALVAVAVVVLATQGRLTPVALAQGGALAMLLLSGPWAQGDGARLMWLLNGAQALMAAFLLTLLGRQASVWVPWRCLVVALAALLAVAFVAFAAAGWLQQLPTALRLVMAALAALLLLVTVCVADAGSREFLRR